MAEVRLCLGRGAYNFSHKICSRHLLESQCKPGKSETQASSLSAGSLLAGFQNGGAENAAVTAGAPQDTRVTPLFANANDVWENGKVAEYYSDFRLKKDYPLSNKFEVQNIERNPPRYRINDKFRGAFCTSRPTRPQQSLGLCLGHGPLVFIRAYSGNGARAQPLYKTKTGYYDILEVSPTATQVQIKTAYYKQSFAYHPDKNAGSEYATVRFSEINEAYTVLGNIALRKRYDRGLLSQSDLVATVRPSARDTGSSAKPQTQSRRSEPGAGSKAGGYDFDAYIKGHYSEQLRRDRELKSRREELHRQKNETFADMKLGRLEVGVALMIVLAVAIMSTIK